MPSPFKGNRWTAKQGNFDWYVTELWGEKKFIAQVRDADAARVIALVPRMYESLVDLLAEAKDTLEDIGPCDHESNACVCELVRKIEEASRLISEIEGNTPKEESK